MSSPGLKTKLFVFDLDGTLVDSAPVAAKILNGMREVLGMLPIAHESYIPWLSHGGTTLIANALDVNVPESLPLLEKFREQYFSLPTPSDSVYAGVFEALEHLQRNQYRLAICTNKPRKLAEKVLRETGLERFFDYISAGGDLPSSKPAVENVRICLRYFNVEPDSALMVGDSRVDQEMADNARIPFIFFTRGYNDGVSYESAADAFSDYTYFTKY